MNKKKFLEKNQNQQQQQQKPQTQSPKKPGYFHIEKVLHQKPSIRRLNQWEFL